MATKSYSKHKEYKEFSSSSKGVPYTDEQFDMIKSELVPKGSKLDSLSRSDLGNGGHREYHYEYKEEKHPSGKYDRRDLRTVEEYTIPPKTVPKKTESNSYFYEREEREVPAITGTRTYNYESNTSSTPGYTKVKSSKVTKDLSHNVEELDSLLDDLQKDQERQLYKSGYTSDTAESSSFDYRKGTPAKAPSSGYSTLKREERSESSWVTPPARTTEMRQEMFREEKTESRVVPSQLSPALPQSVPPTQTVCTNCHQNTSTLSRSSTPMNKVTTTVKTYTYEVPADQDPASIPIPGHASHTYVTSSDVHSTSNTLKPAPSPSLGCQYCSHCNSRVTHYNTTHTSNVDRSIKEHSHERVVYPANDNKHLRPDTNGHGPYGPSTLKFSETTYSREATSSPFPARATPSPAPQQPPKQLDDLMADFTDSRFPTQPDGLTQRNISVTHERSTAATDKAPAVGTSRNVAGPAVYYPPGHTPFEKKPETAAYQASAMSGGGAYASGRGMYEYESGSRSKQKQTEKKTAVPVCLPLCCAMPCVIM